MGNLKLDFKIIIPALVITFSLTSCNEIIRVMDILGMIPPSEPKLELQLEKQAIGEPFSFADYCKEEYDSIFLVYPYFNTEHIDYTSLKMSNSLRGICNANINFDHFSTLLFIKSIVEYESERVFDSQISFSLQDILIFLKSFFSVLKYG